jgi:hypothetical protein
MQDRKSWAVKDEALLGDLLALMEVTDEEKQLLAALQSQADTAAVELTESFYERLLKYENTAEFLDGKVEYLRGKLHSWFVNLFSGEYGQEYVQQRIRIGEVHVQIGLPVRYPLAMMDVMMFYAEKVANQSDNPEAAVEAARKILSLDIAIFNQAYENAQLRHLSEMVGNERLARRLLTES